MSGSDPHDKAMTIYKIPTHPSAHHEHIMGSHMGYVMRCPWNCTVRSGYIALYVAGFAADPGSTGTQRLPSNRPRAMTIYKNPTHPSAHHDHIMGYHMGYVMRCPWNCTFRSGYIALYVAGFAADPGSAGTQRLPSNRPRCERVYEPPPENALSRADSPTHLCILSVSSLFV